MMDYLKYLNMGLTLVAPAAVGLIIGTYLDRSFKAFPFWTIFFIFLGILSGIWGLYKSIKSML